MVDQLTPSQVRELAARLQELKTSLQETLRTSKEAAKPVVLDQSSVGRLSRMDAMQQQSTAKATHRKREVRLQQCIAALRLIEQGSYGECRRCEELIGYARLNANPAALLCMRCQGKSD